LKNWNVILILLLIAFIAILTLKTKSKTFVGNGWYTSGPCNSDSDCVIGGCSEQVCQSKTEPQTITTCEHNPPYPKDLGFDCKCILNKCKWSS